jgi:hypothetical protein
MGEKWQDRLRELLGASLETEGIMSMLETGEKPVAPSVGAFNHDNPDESATYREILSRHKSLLSRWSRHFQSKLVGYADLVGELPPEVADRARDLCGPLPTSDEWSLWQIFAFAGGSFAARADLACVRGTGT